MSDQQQRDQGLREARFVPVARRLGIHWKLRQVAPRIWAV